MKGLQGAIVKTGGRPASDVEDDSDSLDIGEMVGQDTTAPTDDSQNPDNQTLLRLLDYGEKVGGSAAFLLLSFLPAIGSLAIFTDIFLVTPLLNLLEHASTSPVASLHKISSPAHSCNQYHHSFIPCYGNSLPSSVFPLHLPLPSCYESGGFSIVLPLLASSVPHVPQKQVIEDEKSCSD